jgi:hypothetical protein
MITENLMKVLEFQTDSPSLKLTCLVTEKGQVFKHLPQENSMAKRILRRYGRGTPANINIFR